MTRPLSNINLALNRPQGDPGINPATVGSIQAHWDISTLSAIDGTALDITDSVAGLRMFGRTATNADDPTLVTIDGMKWAEFSSSQIEHAGAATEAALSFGTGELTIAVVVRPGRATAGRMRIINKGSNTLGRYAMDMNDTLGGDTRGFLHDGTNSDTALSGASQFADGQKLVFWMVRDNTASELRTYVNDTLQDTEALNVGNIDESTGAGGDLFLNLIWGGGPLTTTTINAFYDGDLGEVIFFGEALNADTIAGVNKYLAGKWGF